MAEQLDPVTGLTEPTKPVNLVDYVGKRRRNNYLSPSQQSSFIDPSIKTRASHEELGFNPDDFNEYMGRDRINLDTEKDYLLDYRAKHQDYKALRSLRSIPTIAIKFGAGLGYVASAPIAALTGDVTMMTNNFWSTWMDHMEEGIKEAVPIFKGSDYHNATNVWDRMGTAGFWTDDFADGVAFMASAFVPGSVLGKGASVLGKTIIPGLGIMGKGGKTTQLAGKIANMNKAVRTAKVASITDDAGRVTAGRLLGGTAEGATNVEKLANNIDIASLTVWNTISEAGFESKDAYRSLKSQGVSDDIAAKAASNVFWGNAVALLVSNGWEQSLMFGRAGKLSKVSRRALRAGEEVSVKGKYLKNLRKQAKTLGRKVNASTGFQGTKAAATGVVAEGFWEENIQHGLQRLNEHLALTDPEALKGYKGWLGDLAGNLLIGEGDVDHQSAIALGAFLGGPMGGAAASVQNIKDKAKVKSLAATLDLNNKFIQANVSSQFEFEQELDEKGEPIEGKFKIKLDEDGNPVINEEARGKLFSQLLHDKMLFDAALAEDAAGNGLAAETINELIFARHVYKSLTNIGLDKEESLQLVKDNIKLQAAKELEGGDVTEEAINELIQTRIDRVDAYAKLSAAIDSRYDEIYGDELDETMKERVKAAQFAEGVKQLFYEDVLAKNSKRSDDFVGIRNLDDSLQEKITTTEDSINTLLEDSYAKFDLLNNKKQVKELAKHLEKPSIEALDNQIEELKLEKEDASPERLTEIEEETTYLNRKKNQVLTEQSALRGHQLHNNSIAIKDPALDVGRDEVKRVTDQESNAHDHAYRVGMSYMNNATFDAHFEKYNNDEISLEELIGYLNDRENFYTLSSEQIARVDDLVNDLKDNDKEIEDLKDKLSKTDAGIEIVPGVFDHNPEYTDIEDNIKKLEAEQREADRLEDMINEVSDRPSTIEDENDYFNKVAEDPNILRKDIGTASLGPIDKALSNYNNSPETYDNVEELLNYINYLNFLLRYYPETGITDKNFLKQFEDRLSELKSAYEQSIKNRQNRATYQLNRKHSTSNQLFTALGIDIDIDQGTWEILDTPMGNKVKEILGEEFLTKLLDIAKDYKSEGINYAFDPIFVEIIADKLKGNKDVISLIDNQSNELAEKISNDKFDTASYLEAPERIMAASSILNYYFDTVSIDMNGNGDHIMMLFKTHRNVPLFIEQVELATEKDLVLDSKVSKDVLLNDFKIHRSVLGLSKLKSSLLSDINIADQLEGEISAHSSIGNEFAPTIEQEMAVREFITFYKTKVGDVPYSNAAYLKGVAGTGKTHAFAKWVVNILGLSTSNVLTASYSENTANNISKSIGTNKGFIVSEITKEDLKDISLLIVDEAGGLTLSDIEHINNVTGGKTKVIYMGDPTQTSDVNHEPAIEDVNNGINGILPLSPLTQVYRSDVSELAQAGLYFQGKNNRVEEFKTKANKALGDSEVMGVHIANDDAAFMKAVNANKTDDSVIIVSTEEDKRKYEKSSVKVLTVKEVHGSTLRNAFVDIKPTDNDRAFNSNLYTAISRASHYAVIRNYGRDWSSIVEKEITSNSAHRTEEKNLNKDRYYNDRMQEQSILETLGYNVEVIEEEPEINDEEVEEEDEPSEEPGIVEVVEEEPSEPQPLKEGGNGIIRLKYPTNPANNYNKDKLFNAVGEPLVIARVRVDGQEDRYDVFFNVNEDDYISIATLSDEDIEGSPELKELIANYEKGKVGSLVGKKAFGKTGHNVTIPKTHGSIVSSDVKLDSFTSLSYHNSGANYSNLKKVWNKWVKGFFFNAGLKPGSSAKPTIKIFTHADIESATNEGLKNLVAGVPYMVIENPSAESKKVDATATAQYIRLTPRAINNEDIQVVQLREYINAARRVEDGTGLTFGSKEFQFLISSLQKSYQIAENINGDKSMVLKKDAPKLEYDKPTSDAIHKVFTSIYGIGKNKDGSYKISRGKGKAQLSLNTLAKGNASTFKKPGAKDAVNSKFDFVVKREVPIGDGKKVTIVHGKQLLPENKGNAAYYGFLRKAYNKVDRIANKWHEKVTAETAPQLEESLIEHGGFTKEELEAILKEFTNPIELDTLDTMFGEQAFDENGRHNVDGNYLRTPLQKDSINELGENPLSPESLEVFDDLLETNFSGVTPTSLSIDVSSATNSVNKPKKIRFSTNIGRRTRTTNAPIRQDKITISEAKKLAKKIIPGITESELNFVSGHMLAKMQRKGEKLAGLMLNGSVYVERVGNGEEVYESVLRHELMHVLYNYYLTDNEKADLKRSINNQFPQTKDMSDVQFDEFLAEQFENYVSKKSKFRTVVENIFNKIINWLGFYKANTKSIESFFDQALKGTRKNKVSFSDSRRTLNNIIRDFGVDGNSDTGVAIQNYEYIRTEILQGVYDLYNGFIDIDSGEILIPETFTEAVNLTYSRFNEIIESEGNGHETLSIVAGGTTKEEVNSRKKKFMSMVNEIYPNWTYSGKIDIKEEEGEEVNLSEEILSSSRKDQESRQSDVVKNALYNITVKESRNKKNPNYIGNFRFYYKQALHLFTGLQSDNINNQLLEYVRANSDETGKSKLMNLVNFIRDLDAKANSTTDSLSYDLPEGMKFTSESVFTANGVTYTKMDKENNNEFFSRILDEIGDDYTIALIDLFNKERARNTLVELFAHFSSQRESNFYFLHEEGNDSRKSFRYKRSDKLGVHTSYKSDIKEAIYNEMYRTSEVKGEQLENKPNIENARAKWVSDNKDALDQLNPAKASSKASRREGLLKSLHALGLSYLTLDDIPDMVPKRLATDVYMMFTQHLILDNRKSFDENYSDNVEGIVNKLAKKLGEVDDMTRATSIKNAKGDRIFTFSDSSQGMDVLTNLSNNSKFKGSIAKSSKSKSLPAHLDSPFFKNNIFVNGLGMMGEVVDHDAIKINDGYKIDYTKEDDAGFLKRTFVGGFIESLNSNTNSEVAITKNGVYTQFLYTTSNRPNISGAKVKYLNKKEIKKSFIKIFDQVKTRSDKGAEYIDKYNPNSNINLGKVNKDGSISGISQELIKKVRSGEISSEQAAEIGIESLNSRIEDFKKKVVKELSSNLHGINLGKFSKEISRGPIHNQLTKELSTELAAIEDKEDRKKYLNTEVDRRVKLMALNNAAEEFFMNNYVNSYFLNQLVVGDYGAGFKDSLTVIKRMSGVFAPGKRPNTTPGIGMNKTYNLVNLQDVEIGVKGEENSVESFLNSIFKDQPEVVKTLLSQFGDFETTDAQGFILPSRLDQLQKGFGKSYNASNILKPAHYEIVTKKLGDEEITFPVMIKYSAVVLTDQLLGITGPKNEDGVYPYRKDTPFLKLIKLRETMEKSNIDEAVFNSGVKAGILKKNPVSFADIGTTELPMELSSEQFHTLSNDNYRMQLNPIHKVDSKVSTPTQLVYFLSDQNNTVDEASSVYKAFEYLINKGANKSIDEMYSNPTEVVRKKTEGVDREARAHELIAAGVKIDFPMMIKKGIIQMANYLTDKTTKIKFKGGKLVLQSAEGYVNPETGERLKYKIDGNGLLYAEVIVPKEYKKNLQLGDYLHGDMLAWRIPSTELHSALPMKVVGFYDTKGETNVIIAPRELVALHGSDFDVDALFVIRRENFSGTSNPIGYHKNEGDKWVLTEDPDMSNWNNSEIESYYRNVIMENFLMATQKESTRARMMEPISMSRFDEYKDKDDANTSDILDNLAVYRSNFDGATLTGVFANMVKALSYMTRAGENNKSPLLHENNQFTYLGTSYTSLSQYENGRENTTWQTFDSLINAAIDNVKEQILPSINASGATSNLIGAAVALGMPLDDVVDLALSPIAVEGSRLGKLERAIKLFDEALELTEDEYTASNEEITKFLEDTSKITFEELIRYLEANPNMIAAAVNVRDTISKLHTIGDNISVMANYLSLLKEQPITRGDIKNTEERIETINSDEFAFVIPNFYNVNPHIQEVENTFNRFKDVLSQTFFSESDEMTKIIEKIFEDVSDNNIYFNKTKNDAGSKVEFIKDEFIKFILTGIESTQHIFEESSKDGSKTGPEVWNAHFAKELSKFKKGVNTTKYGKITPAMKPFLKYLYIERRKGGNKVVKYGAGVNLDGIDVLKLQRSAEALPIELQKDLGTYAVMNHGMGFGGANFSQYLNHDIIVNIQKEYNTLVSNLGDSGASLTDYFLMNLFLNEIDSLKGFSKGKFKDDVISNAKKELSTEEYEVELAIRNPKKEGEDTNKYSVKDLPLYLKRFPFVDNNDAYQNNIKATLLLRIDSVESDIVRYVKIGKERVVPYYNLPTSIIEGGFNIMDQFSKGGIVPTRLTDKIFKTTRNIEEGSTIKIFPSESRLQEYDVTITGKKVLRETPHYTQYEYEYTKVDEVYKINNKFNGENQFYADKEAAELSKILPKHIAVRIQDDYVRVLEGGAVAEGVFANGMIEISRKGGKGIAYHEAFHAVWRTMLSDQERVGVLGDAIKTFRQPTENDLRGLKLYHPNLNEQQILELYYEEAMADAFADYMYGKSPIKYSKGIRGIFERLMIWINSVFNNSNKVEKLFGDIKGGGFANNQPVNISATTDEAYKISEDDASIVDSILEKSKQFINDVDEKGDQASTYTHIPSGTTLKRITDNRGGFMTEFTGRTQDESINRAESIRDKIWGIGEGAINHDTKLQTDLAQEPITADEYVILRTQVEKRDAIKGRLLHKVIEGTIVKDVAKKREIADEIDEMAAINGINPYEYQWMGKAAPYLLSNIPSDNDEFTVHSEVTVGSELAGYAGTVDALIEHEDGFFSIVDWKTGARFNKEKYQNLLKYGDRLMEVYDNPRDRAKLQVMIYAMLLKLENPDMKFRHLKVVWTAGRHASDRIDHRSDVDVNTFLEMLEMYFKNEKPEDYSKMVDQSPDVFNVGEYTTKSKSVLDLIETVGPAKAKQKLRQEITNLNNKERLNNKLEAADQEELIKYSKRLIELESEHGVSIDGWDNDLSFGATWLSNLSSTRNPYIDAVAKVVTEEHLAAKRKHETLMKRFDAKLLPILNKYLSDNNKPKVATALNSKLNFIVPYSNDPTKPGLYNFAYTTEDVNGIKKTVLISKEESPVEWNKLTKEQQVFLRFVQKEMGSFFTGNGVMNKTATYIGNKQFTNMDMANKSRNGEFKYTTSFLPRVPKTEFEIRADHPPLLSKGYWKHAFLKNFTMFYEDMYNQWNNDIEAIPVKYLGSDYTFDSENHSFDLQHTFNLFTRNMINKEHLDEAYAVSQGVLAYTRMKNTSSGKFKNTIKFLEDNVLMHLQNKNKYDQAFLRAPIRMPIGDGKTVRVTIGKALLSGVSAVSAPIMWLMPINGTRNGVFIGLINRKKAISDSFAEKFYGVEGSTLDFKWEDVNKGNSEWFKMQADMMQGKGKHNKMWLLAKHLGYLPDNYDWVMGNEELTGSRRDFSSLLTSSRTMYSFHTIPEEWSSQVVMTAQMMKMKNKNTGKSLWDSYEVVFTDAEGNEFDKHAPDRIASIKWVGGTRGYIKESSGEERELTELDANEVRRMKRVYEQMHGGYRKDEKTILEAYVFGKIALHFRKYLPVMLKNAFQSKAKDPSIGNYEVLEKNANGEDVMKWVSATTEGRWRAMSKHLLNALRLSSSYKEYSIENLSNEDKKQLMNGWVTITSMWMMMIGHAMVFADADDDDALKNITDIVIQNYSQPYNPMDILRNFAEPIPLFEKTYDIATGFQQLGLSTALMLSGQEDEFKGTGQLLRGTPVISSMYSWSRWMERGDWDDYTIFNTRD